MNENNTPDIGPSKQTENQEIGRRATARTLSKRDVMTIILIVIATIGVVLTAFLTSAYWMPSDSAGGDGVHEDNNGASTSETPEYPPQAHPADFDLSPADAHRANDLEIIGLGLVTSYRVTHGKYPKDAQELRSHSDRQEYNDPATNEPYVYTDSTPKRGEIQYKPAYLCEDNLRALREDRHSHDNVYALVFMMDDGSYLCKSNVQ